MASSGEMNARRHDNGVMAPTNAKELAPMTDAVQLPPDKIKGEARSIGEIIRPIVDRIMANEPFDTDHKHGKINSAKE